MNAQRHFLDLMGDDGEEIDTSLAKRGQLGPLIQRLMALLAAVMSAALVGRTLNARVAAPARMA